MVLAPGDTVEVTDDLNPGYRIKLDTPYAKHFYVCADSELVPWSLIQLPFGRSDIFDEYSISSYDSISSSSPEVRAKRKEAGECETCAIKLSVSVWGLQPCLRCSPPQPVKW